MVPASLACTRQFQEPAKHLFKYRGVQRIDDELPVTFVLHQPRVLQRIEVVRDAGLRHIEKIGDFPGRPVLFTQQPENLPPGRVGERFERFIQLHILLSIFK